MNTSVVVVLVMCCCATQFGFTALGQAKSCGHDECVQLLTQYEADKVCVYFVVHE